MCTLHLQYPLLKRQASYSYAFILVIKNWENMWNKADRAKAFLEERIVRLRADIAYRENELALWKSELTSLEEQVQLQTQSEEWNWPLSQHEYERYSRQMIVPEFGLQGKIPPIAAEPS